MKNINKPINEKKVKSFIRDINEEKELSFIPYAALVNSSINTDLDYYNGIKIVRFDNVEVDKIYIVSEEVYKTTFKII